MYIHKLHFTSLSISLFGQMPNVHILSIVRYIWRYLLDIHEQINKNPLGGVLKYRGHFCSKRCDQDVFPRQPVSEITRSRYLLCHCLLIRKIVLPDGGIDQWIILLHMQPFLVTSNSIAFESFVCRYVKFNIFFTCEINHNTYQLVYERWQLVQTIY